MTSRDLQPGKTEEMDHKSDDGIESGQSTSRRDFVRRGAAGIAAGVAALAATSASTVHAAWPPSGQDTPKYKGWSSIPDAYEMYTESEAWSEQDVVSWEGKSVGGFSVGVIQLVANIPMIPGNVGNATTFDFAMLYQPMEVTGEMVVSSKPNPEVTRRSIEACRMLEKQGVRAITGNCGFFANYQQEIAAELNVPFFGSSLLQIPLILMGLRSDEKVAVLTANGPTLAASPALKNSGVADPSRVVIAGAEGGNEMQRILNAVGAYNPRRLEQELSDLAKETVKKDPKVAATLLECTEMGPHARAVQKAVGKPVWAFPDLVNWIISGVVRRSYRGFV